MITSQRILKAAGKHFSRSMLAARAALGAHKDWHCPACRHDVAGFFRYGAEREWGCIRCGASPRERLMHALLDAGLITIPDGAAILHCAPNEGSLVQRFYAGAGDYVPADIDPDRYGVPGMQQLDLMSMSDEARFDRVYASHVMEHVPDDAVVLRNVLRALKPGGEAWLLVPLWEKPSEDGPRDLSGRERERRFGQWDHVRQYGRDFAERIRAAGFEIEIIDAAALPADQVRRMALADTLFRARRPA
ncbi:methyltransferase domain-containing protein [Sphingobium nicotianae]|uniref:Methyltransferase domain-containing protein n=1 Tax=Sphingobium nicotianae TaxID=2782607 RepID=A0A9X1AJB1_9SPHN|nr:methyltransferase domain-containing protein [Sphingobium nicotianae]MBT2185716.1 methyltransferase domain-containing protein [Sphingobium nicotianae]